jgi:hypothetical protein
MKFIFIITICVSLFNIPASAGKLDFKFPTLEEMSKLDGDAWSQRLVKVKKSKPEAIKKFLLSEEQVDWNLALLDSDQYIYFKSQLEDIANKVPKLKLPRLKTGYAAATVDESIELTEITLLMSYLNLKFRPSLTEKKLNFLVAPQEDIDYLFYEIDAFAKQAQISVSHSIDPINKTIQIKFYNSLISPDLQEKIETAQEQFNREYQILLNSLPIEPMN